jgi:hypothetical protein
VRLLLCLALLSAGSVYSQEAGRELSPSNLDPPQASPPPPVNEEPQQEPTWSIFDYVDPTEPRFYAKLGLLLGSVLLARKAYRQMKAQ